MAELNLTREEALAVLDVNSDGVVNLMDIVAILHFIKQFDTDNDNEVKINDLVKYLEKFDLDKDGKINVDDILVLYNYLYKPNL